MKMLRNLTFLSLALLLMVGCGKKPVVQQQIRPVKLFTVESLGYVNRDFAGIAVAEETSDLAFRVSGQIIEFNVDEGQAVKKGELIARLDPRDFDYKLEAARSSMVTAKAKLDRTSRLLSHQAVSRQDYEIAQTQYAEAKAAYENALGALNDTRLRAPFSGNIEKQYLFNYQRADAGQQVVKLVAPETLKIRFTMPESGLRLLTMPDKVFTVLFDNYPRVEFAARLKEYVPSSSTATGVPVTLMVDDKKANTAQYPITPGMSCTINLRINNNNATSLAAVPINAIYSPPSGGTFVWVFEKDSTVNKQSVVLGELMGSDMVEVKSGVLPDQKVVSAGVNNLTQGEKVKVLQ